MSNKHFVFDDMKSLFRAKRLDARLQANGVPATERSRYLETISHMNKFDSIAATSGNNEARRAMKRAIAERALTEIGMRVEKIHHVMAGARQITVADVDAAMQLKAELYVHDVNEKRKRNKNFYRLEAKDTFTVEQAMEESVSDSQACADQE
jgi:hypothetical protein